MVVGEASIHNIMGGMESTGGVRLHNHKRKLKQRFDIIKKLGQGTYGKVQLGINKETGQEVAIKTIKKCKIETEADLIRIRREIQIMSSVQHPNIIHIYEVFENREKMVLVMEYAAGGELYDYLSERKVLTEEEARRIFRQIATAVFYCHKHKICHRDLKLENILLDQTGNAKIADFGLSNVFDEQRLLHTFCGSPLYASPEIVKGTPYHGPEVDCWSLGVLLYTLVYGAMPFDGSNFKRLVKQISQSDYFEPTRPSPASPLIKEMLTVCPARRADIERICTHWWVNETYEQNCLDIAEDLAAQTPVRLDLLLSLVPQSASAEKLLVGNQQSPASDTIGNDVSSKALVPTRCHSVGSLMELDQNSSDRRIRELFEDEARSGTGDAKRKLETTPSTEETTTAAGAKRKERSRKKERPEDREARPYKSASRHHSAPIPNSITEEAMEIESAVSVPTCKTADLSQIEGVAACLELIEECAERSPSKERSRTPTNASAVEQPQEIGMQTADGVHDLAHDQVTVQSLPDDIAKSFDTSNVPIVESTDIAKEQLNDNSKPEMHKEINLARDKRMENQSSVSQDDLNVDVSPNEFKMLKEKALSLDSDTRWETGRSVSATPVDRRRMKIFETAEKFNQMASGTECEKPKKIFIPGVNVGGAKRVFERKASLSSLTTPPAVKTTASKVIIPVPVEKKTEKSKQQQESTDIEERNKKDDAKKRAVDIISGAIGKPPVQKKVNGSPPTSPMQDQDVKRLPLKIPVAPNDARSAVVSVSTPTETRFSFDGNSEERDPIPRKKTEATVMMDECPPQSEEPKMSSKMEITLKSATLPRPRKTSKAEIMMPAARSSEPIAFKTEVEAKIDAFQPQKLRTQRSEIAFPVAAAVPQSNRSSSLEPEGKPRTTSQPKERIIPIQVEPGHQPHAHSSTPPPSSKPPMPQRSMSQRSGSLSRQSTADSDTDSALGSTIGPEPIRKSPREYIIPIAVEGGGYVTPRSGSVEPESKTSTPTTASAPRSSRFARPRRMSSLLSDASEDESPFSSLHRDSEDLLQRHMHRLRSSRPSRQPSEHADSLSSGEDDDDDGFELLTAENLFSTLLSRVRSLTQRLNVDDNRNSSFPSSRLFGRLGSNSPQAFWGLNKPLSRRLTESQFKHSLSREGDIFSRKDAGNSSNPGTPNSPSSQGTPSRENVFETGSNTLPRDKVSQEELSEAAAVQAASNEAKEKQESLEQNFTPSLARRLSRHLIEESVRSLARSSSVPYGDHYYCPSPDNSSLDPRDLVGDRSRNSSVDSTAILGTTRPRPRPRSVSASRASFGRSHAFSFPETDHPLMSLDQSLNQSALYSGRKPRSYQHRRNHSIAEESLNPASYRELFANDRIQEEGLSGFQGVEDSSIASTPSGDSSTHENVADAALGYSQSTSECAYDPSSANSYKNSESSKNFENRLLAAENLIKESKLKNLGPAKYNRNLTSSYKDSEKCQKESLDAMTESSNSISSKRRSYIPSLRLRSVSLTREAGLERDKSASASAEGVLDATGDRRASSPEKSLLSKFFRGSASSRSASEKNTSEDSEKREKASAQKPKQHRISRFLRPDFFDTPREESRYAKEKDAQKAAENERRKSRFIKRKSESKPAQVEREKEEKDTRNQINSTKKSDANEAPRDSVGENSLSASENRLAPVNGGKSEPQVSRGSFLHSLERKLEKFRSSEDNSASKALVNGSLPSSTENAVVEQEKSERVRENSAPPTESTSEPSESNKLKKTLSVEDVTFVKNPTSTARSKVSSVLGLFKNSDTKQRDTGNGTGSSRAILSKLKKSPPKCSASNSNETSDSSSTSRIPTKSSKVESKTLKKTTEITKQGPEKSTVDRKKSPPKEKSKEKEINEDTAKDKRNSKESQKELSSNATPNVSDPKLREVESNATVPEAKKNLSQTENGRKGVEERSDSFAEKHPRVEDKKLAKTKKNISLMKSSSSIQTTESNGSGTKVDTKTETTEKRGKKIVKPKEAADKEEGDATKKKRIVRVVKKVVKKSSDSSTDTKSDEKPKSVKIRPKRISPGKTEQSTEPSSSSTTKTKISKETENESRTSASSSLRSSSSAANTEEKEIRRVRSNSHELPLDGAKTAPTEQSKCSEEKPKQSAPRGALKLDLTKIPQHAFRNSTPKKDSPKADMPRITSQEYEKTPEEFAEETLECLSKMTHRASITGNKIIIDKPLRAKDVAELKKGVTECAKIIEAKIETETPLQPVEDNHPVVEKAPVIPSTNFQQDPVRDSTVLDEKPQEPAPELPVRSRPDYSQEVDPPIVVDCPRTSRLLETGHDLLSPTDDPESFDSWSLSSLEYSQPRAELASPGSPSPTHSSMIRGGDHSDSVIDRIRRRSFYSRFNDRRRPSLTVPPPGITLPTSSATLPRKFGSKLSSSSSSSSSYGVGFGVGLPKIRHSERLYEPYDSSSDILSNSLPPSHRKSNLISRDRYPMNSMDLTSGSSYLIEPKSPPGVYESRRRYPPRSSSLELSGSRVGYSCGDFNPESETSGVACSRTGSLSDSLSGSLPDAGRAGCSLSSMSRKYTTGSITPEPKSIEYYEELLAPSNPEYLFARKSPLSVPSVNEYTSRCENGYHNGNLDHSLQQVHSSGARARRRSSYALSEKLSSPEEFSAQSQLDENEHKRSDDTRTSETRTLSADSMDLLSSVRVTESTTN